MASDLVRDPELLGWPPDGPTLALDYRRFSYAGKFVMSNTGKAVIRGRGGAEEGNSRRAGLDEGSDCTCETGAPDAETDDPDDLGGGVDEEDSDDGPDDDVDREPDPDDGPTDRDSSDWDDDVLAAAAFNEDRTDGDALWIRYVTVRADRRGEGLGPELCGFVAAAAADRGYERVRIAVNNPFAYEALYRAGFAYTGEQTGIAELVLERPADASAMRAAPRSVARYREGMERYARRELSPEETEFLERKRDGTPPEPPS